ncbi:MAG: acyl-CoA thioesterase [Elusimicrobiota bacterium]|jgi:acyl-CoA thioester hydrolase|nr:acyl-CoA thioesterase [Elusimicrobiota bacterium]
MPRVKYFKTDENAPTPLTFEIKRKVRFDELDPLGIMWHGNYASFFEEARVALGGHYGIGYLDFANNKTSIPLKKFYVDFMAPLEFNKTYTIKAILHYNPAARLDFEYEIYDEENRLMTTACSVHLMLDMGHNTVLVAKPEFFENFCKKWREGSLNA